MVQLPEILITNALFYLRARGIESKEAVKMIIKGFLEGIYEKIKNKEIERFY